MVSAYLESQFLLNIFGLAYVILFFHLLPLVFPSSHSLFVSLSFFYLFFL
jgi:hypothetical protein